MLTKFPLFWSNPWTNPFGKMPILWVFDTDVFVVQNGLFVIKNVENRLLTIYFRDLWHGNTRGYKRLLGVRRGYRWLQGVTMGYKGLQGVTRGYKGLQGVTTGDRGWQWVTRNYRNFFLTRTFADTFSWSILHNNQSWRNLKFLTKTIYQKLWKNSYFGFFINSCFYSL